MAPAYYAVYSHAVHDSAADVMLLVFAVLQKMHVDSALPVITKVFGLNVPNVELVTVAAGSHRAPVGLLQRK